MLKASCFGAVGLAQFFTGGIFLFTNFNHHRTTIWSSSSICYARSPNATLLLVSELLMNIFFL